jgi:hypothetical protein
MSKVIVTGYIPERHLQEWMQHIRDFDTHHQGCHLNIEVVTELDTKQVNELLDQVDPPLPLRETILKQ